MLGLMASVVLVVGCAKQEDSQPAKEEVAATTIFLQHKVADYSKWRPVYDADASRRAEAGLQEAGIYRNAEDENMVLIVWQAQDTSALSAMLQSPELADKMRDAGVTSTPETWVGEPLQAGAGTVFLKHTTTDYSAWRPHYDADAPRRVAAGLQNIGVYRNVDDENEVILVWSAEDGAAVQAMLESPELADLMKEAGVIGRPEVWMAAAM